MELSVKEKDVVLQFASDFLKSTRADLKDATRSFFKIGFRLNEAVDLGYVTALGYEDIYQLAEAQFDFKSTTTKNLMEINRAYSDKIMNKFGKTPQYSMYMDPRFEKYNQSQLIEMLPLQEDQRACVPESMTIKDLRDYKKAVMGRYQYGIGYSEAIKNPDLAVKEYRRVMATIPEKKYTAEDHTSFMKRLDKLISPKNNEDVAPGQIGIDECFYQTGGEEFIGQTSDRKQSLAEMFAEEEEKLKPKRLHLKNRKEREDFVNNEKNYPILVLDNDELGLTVRRLDFANGIKLYRTTFAEYQSFAKTTVQRVKLHLIDENLDRERPPASASCTDYMCRCYTLDGTAPGYVVKYMAKYKDEI